MRLSNKSNVRSVFGSQENDGVLNLVFFET